MSPWRRVGTISPLRREWLDPPNEGEDDDGTDADSDDDEVLLGDAAEEDGFEDAAESTQSPKIPMTEPPSLCGLVDHARPRALAQMAGAMG